MTFRQILNIIWQRRWLVVAVVVLAVIVAAVVIQRQTPVYTSTATVRYSVSMTDASLSGQIGTIPVDVDPETVTSPTVLEPAAGIAGESSKHALQGAVTVTTEEGARTTRLTIVAEGPTPRASQLRANAVVKAYSDYLQGQVDAALASLEERKTQATAEAVSYQTQVAQNPADSIAASNLTNALSSLASINSQIDTINTSGAPITVLKPAAPGKPVGTSPPIILALALTAGLIAGIGLALIRDQFDNRLRGEHEVEELTGVPSLGELSLDKRVARQKERLPTGNRKRTALNEGLRALRTTLQVLLPTKHALVVLTSVEPGDGKTFVSANLALAWARSRKSVVLVGGDLRRPGLADYFGEAAEGPGLSELLQYAVDTGTAPSAAEIIDLLKPTEYPGLLVLPSGDEPFEPADLLAVAALSDVLQALREVSDIVVVDSPPSMALTDASLLAADADGAVVVATVRRTDRGRLVETIRTLQANGVSVLGIVSNRSRRRLPKTYGAYYSHDRSGAQAKAARVLAAAESPAAATNAAPEPDDTELPDELDAELDQSLGGAASATDDLDAAPPSKPTNRR